MANYFFLYFLGIRQINNNYNADDEQNAKGSRTRSLLESKTETNNKNWETFALWPAHKLKGSIEFSIEELSLQIA